MRLKMHIKEKIQKYCEATEQPMLFMDGFDDAILGWGAKFTSCSVVYSKKKIIEKLSCDMTLDEAYEYFDFNIAGAYVGEHTPFILDDITSEDEEYYA